MATILITESMTASQHAGTEVQLTVPASVAYEPSLAKRWLDTVLPDD